LVQSAFLGARVTCFAYGQTGSGKTYTMNGEQGKTAGLYILGAKDIFALQTQKQYNHLKITVSFFEIYCGRLFDLLNGRNELKLREDNKANIHIVGLEEKPIFNPQEFMQVIYDGSNVRITSQNSTNA
jgi:kinesin family protein 2/24